MRISLSNKMKLVGWTLGILFGVFVFIFGGYDDSPGAQGLGLLFVIISVVRVVKIVKAKNNIEEIINN